MKANYLSLLWTLIFAGFACSDVEFDETWINPRVIQLTFGNETEATDHLQYRVIPRRVACSAAPDDDRPLVYCWHAEYPEDVVCNIGMLLDRDVFPKNMEVRYANTAIPDPERPGKFCVVYFENTEEDEVNPIRFVKIVCGRDREIISEETSPVPSGIDSMSLLPQFKVANMSDIVITSVNSYFDCWHRFKRLHAARKTKKNAVQGAVFQLDSFACDPPKGIADGRPEMPYRADSFYKYDGRRWRPTGKWLDYRL